MKQRLARYLADYIKHEAYERSRMAVELDLQMVIEQGIEAFESTEDVELRFYHPPTTSHHAYYED